MNSCIVLSYVHTYPLTRIALIWYASAYRLTACWPIFFNTGIGCIVADTVIPEINAVFYKINANFVSEFVYALFRTAYLSMLHVLGTY